MSCMAMLTTGESFAAKSDIPPYRNPKLPVAERVKDLLNRMTLAEKARQLDMYSGASDFLDASQRDDHTHAKPDAVFDPQKAEKVLGKLGAGSIHDLYPSPKLYNRLHIVQPT